MELLRELWSGQMPLRRAFWVFGALGGMFFGLMFSYLNWTNEAGVGSPWVILLGLAAYFAYFTVVSVGVWRSANRYNGAMRYSILAKLVVMIWVAGMINTVAAMFGQPLK